MVNALSPIWFSVALALGIGLTFLFIWIRNNNISMKWYDWIIGIFGLLFLLLSIQHLAGTIIIETEHALQHIFVQ